MELDERALVDELVRVHGAHTVVLYGSRARGDAQPSSDVDVAAFREGGEPARDGRIWNEMYLDAFVYPDTVARAPDASMLRLRGGKVLLDARGLASGLMNALDALEAKGPTPLPESEKTLRRTWARKMLERAARGDPEGDYRRAWLLFDLLEAHFLLRDRWYRGPKQALTELARDDRVTHALFVTALKPGASLDAIAVLVERVTSA